MKRSGKKQRILRNIKFWGSNVEQMFLMGIAFMAFYMLVFGIQTRETGFADRAISWYIVTVGVLFCFLTPISYGGSYIPIALGFGSGRKEVVCGFQVANVLMWIEMTAVFAVLELLQTGVKTDTFDRIIFFAAITLFVTAIGQIGTAVQLKFGGKWIFAAVVIVMMLILIVILVFGINMGGSLETNSNGIVFQFKIANIPINIVAVIVAILSYAVSLGAMFAAIRKYEVRQ